MAETRYQRIAREQAERQAARMIIQKTRRNPPVSRTLKERQARQEGRSRTADRIDGYDRDDLGESPDY